MAAAAVAPAQQHAAGRSVRPNFEVELQAIEDYRRFAALTIQRYLRGRIVRLHRARKESARREQQQSAAAQQAEAARLYKAARTIQDSWRCYKNKRVYRFFRDLIKFREAAEPRQLLRCINASEAALVDPAAGLHVRLRLGGSTFPPVLLYKVFTHRPVTDICAFGPRNYAAETAASKQTAAAAGAAAAKQHATSCTQQSQASHTNSSSSRSNHTSRVGWYCRDDRNGWRPVVELQQQQDHQHSSSSSSRSRHRAMPLRQRRSRLQLAHSKASSSCTKWTAAGCAGLKDVVGGIQEEEAERSGYGSEAGMQVDTHEYLHRSKQQQNFHHSPLVRRAERAQRLKQRRRQWLLKMYRTSMHAVSRGSSSSSAATAAAQPSTSGMLPCADPGSSSNSIAQQQQQQRRQGSAPEPVPCQACSQEEQLLRQLEQQLLLAQGAESICGTNSSSTVLQQAVQPGSSTGCTGGTGGTRLGSDEGWDLDELMLLGLDAGILTWAQKLDFDSYQQQWSSTAVTLGSEVVVPQSERALLQQLG